MNIPRTLIHKRDITPVLLQPVSDSEQIDSNLEPQMVRIRSPNTARLYIDSQKPFFEFSPNKIRISTSTKVNGQPENLLINIYRLSVAQFNMFWQPCNVNTRNNEYEWTITDLSGPTGYTFSHTITPDNYTLTSLMTSIANTMTTDSNSVGLTGGFSVSFDPNGFLATLDDNIPNTNFIFNFAKSSLVYNGASLLALPFMDAPVTSLLIGPARMLYSRYVDVVSDDLCSYIKNPNRSIGKINQNVVLRQYLDESNPNWTYKTILKNLNWINWNSSSPLSVINFRLYDEYGSLFYFIPTTFPVSTSTLNWTMEIILEI